MHRRLLRWVSLVVAPVTLLAMALLSAGTAQAAGITVGDGATTSVAQAARAERAATAGQPAAAMQGSPAVKPGGSAVAGASDTRRVCVVPGRGFAGCMSLLRTNVKSHAGLFAADAAPSGYGPSDLQSAYDLPSAAAGGGATVAVVDAYDDPDAEADLQVYRAQYGLPVCDTANGCFQKVNQDGRASPLPPPAGSNGWDVEESLDIDMVSAVCPNCGIILVEADSNADSDLYAAEDEAVALGARYVSDSWGGGEYPGETSDDQYFDHPGVVITAAGGDNGYLNQGAGGDTPNYPAASPDVTAVGGTTLTRDPGTARGWAESVWGSAAGGEGTGSGCSLDEPKPSWQADTGCANRATDDVSAVADPGTGVALYDSYSAGGWEVAGGTSVATPIIASVYALAGAPAAGSNPARYPYTDPSGLNDVTSGANGTCTPAYLCTAGPGYDGPTGLGTPDGVAAFSGGPSGDITGQVTSAATGAPIAGATVTDAQGYTARTGADGDYALDGVLAGSYDVTASAYGYTPQAQDRIQVSAGSTATASFALAAVPSGTLSGTVSDGSGHKWPVYSEITITGNGYPGGPIYTNPGTGAYRVTLPEDAAYQLLVTPQYPGYAGKTVTVKLGATSVQKNIKVAIDATACTAPGYGWDGTTETFTGWSGATAQDGWAVTGAAGTGQTWRFDNPAGRPPPGGDEDFAIADSAYYGKGGRQDTALVSPVQNLTAQATPQVSFDSGYYGHHGQAAAVQVSTDGGQSWATVWHKTTGDAVGTVTVPLPQAAGQADVRVRFQFTGADGWWWAVDDVFIGSHTCVPVRGGLITGTVSASTGTALDGATITSKANPSDTGVSAPGSDPALPDGFYWLFSSLTGNQRFTAADPGYTTATTTVHVIANKVTQQDWTLTAAGG